MSHTAYGQRELLKIGINLFLTKKGFRGDGKNVCYDINECRERSHNCERRNGICTNKKGMDHTDYY